MERQNPGQWENTINAKERLKDNPFFEEPDQEALNGYFAGRPIIGRDTPINGGVYVGAGSREAIVVDEKYGELDKAYEELIERRRKKEQYGIDFKKGVLKDVYDLTVELMPPNMEVVKKIAEDNQLQPDQKIPLDYYVQNHGGVCRHEALLAGYLLERAAKEGRISGKTSIDRNTIPGIGGHAWVRYTNSEGKVYIIDPAQAYVGRLENVQEDRENGIGRWFYERPEDLGK